MILLLSCVSYAGCSPQFNRGTAATSSDLNGLIASSKLSLAVAHAAMSVGGSTSLTASGGVSPYSYSVVSGGGTITGTTYTAPGSPATVVVQVKDAASSIATATIVVSPVSGALSISPSTVSLALNNTETFSATGGTPPYTFAIDIGGGSINANTGVYTAPASSGSAIVQVTDSYGNISYSSVSINYALAISPSSKTLAVNDTTTFTASLGVAPYTYSIFSGTGSINASTGVYTAPAGSGVAVVRATDAVGNTTNAAVTINSAVSISPSSISLAVSDAETFSATGGVSPYTYTVASGGGSINATTGVYTAGVSAGSASILVTDSLGNTSSSTVTINAALAISPSSYTLAVNDLETFSGSGGVSPYTFSVVFGTGSINSSTGVYTAPASTGSATVQIKDSLGNTANSSVTINPALAISPTGWVMGVNQTKTFSATGGVSPYTYSKTAGTGSIGSSSGIYTAPGSFGTATVQVADAVGNTLTANIVINNAVAISPNTLTLSVSDPTTFTANGGLSPYTFSSILGAINSSTGVYSAPPACGSYPCTDTVTVTDSASATSTATVTVNAPLAISPASDIVMITNQITFSATGGVGSHTYSAVYGTINSSTGAYTAPGSAKTDTITVTDSIGNTSTAAVTVNPQIAFSPSARYLAINSPTTLKATGGVTPYTFVIQSNSAQPGSLQSCSSGICSTVASCTASSTVSCQFTGGTTSGEAATLQVTDALSNTATGTITTVKPLQVAAGVNQACALMDNGTIQCWGRNFYGALGNGSLEDSLVPVQVNGITDATAVVGSGPGAGQDFFCALILGGTVQCWGDDSNGQIGNGGGSGGVQMTPVSVAGITAAGPSTTATSLALGGVHACALMEDTSMMCWGYNGYGELGNGTQNSSSTPTYVQASVGVTLTDVSAITAGANHTCALLSTGSIDCWGSQSNGQLGNGVTDSSTYQLYPVLVETLASASAVVAGGLTTCAVNSGTLYCWGYNGNGQLALGSTTDYNTPQSTGLTGITMLAASQAEVCAVISGTLECWGANYDGGVGDGTTNTRESATIVSGPITTATSIAVGHGNGYGFTCASLSSGVVQCWGYNGFGEVGNGAAYGVVVPTTVSGLSTTATAVADGADHVCALLSNQTVQCWGYNGYGQLGNGTTTNSLTPVTVQTSVGVNLTGIIAIDAGTDHNCALNNAGSVYCWGWNNNGEIGDGTQTQRPYATQVSSISNATAIATGSNYSCALISGGTMQCWGYNGNGQLGNGTTVQSTTPVPVLISGSGTTCGSGNVCLTGVSSITAATGSDTTCAILSGGTAMCWGLNSYGQLGNTTTNDESYPSSVQTLPGTSLTGISQMETVGVWYPGTCAIVSGSIYCWGDNNFGQLGNGTSISSDAPNATVVGISNAVSLTGGFAHFCALLQTGSIECWGDNNQGELGSGYIGGDDSVPSPINATSTFSSLGSNSGGERTCAVTTAGAVMCWGNDQYGEVNNISGNDQYLPTNVVF